MVALAGLVCALRREVQPLAARSGSLPGWTPGARPARSQAARGDRSPLMTRYGVLSDVHANLPALDVALAFLAGQDVDRFICAGDLVGYGPHPNECVERVLALPGV